MEKVASNSQAQPLWERQKRSSGHRSAVDRALEAHRQRTSERQMRTQQRLNMVRGMHNQFFSPPQMAPQQAVAQDPVMVAQPPQIPQVDPQETTQAEFLNPRQIDHMYNEAELGSSEDSALILVNKEIQNPEEGPVEDVPRGSYIDYRV